MLCQLMKISMIKKKRIYLLNRISIPISFVISLTMYLLTTCRVEELYYFHIFVGFIGFILGPILFIIHSWISFYFTPEINSYFITYLRLILTIAMIFDGIFFGIWKRIADLSIIPSEDNGYIQHIIAAITEYIFVLIITPYFATYITEIQRLKVISIAEFEYQFEL